MSRKKDCIQRHPKTALEAWQMVVPFDPNRTDYLEEWKNSGVFNGLNAARVPKGKIRENDTSVQHPASIRDQFSIQHALEEIPNETAARESSCVRFYDKRMTKTEAKERNHPCPKKGQECYSVNPDGHLESAESLAKKAYGKEHKGQVAHGFCMGRGGVVKSNLQNKWRFTDELQQAYDRIAVLEDKLATERGRKIQDNC